MMKLPLIESISQTLPAEALKNSYLIAAQHILPTTVSMVDALLRLGMKPHQISIIGKYYSTDFVAFQALIDRGVDVSISSISFDPYVSYDAQYNKNVRQFVQERMNKLLDPRFKRIVVLDDGGDLILTVNDLDLPFDRIGGIEQTTSGYNRISKISLRFPVVNLALAETKLQYEPSHITHQALDELLSSGLTPKRALVIGKGTVGTSVTRHLSQVCHVDAYDIREGKSDFGSTPLEQILPNYDLIIGCTGTISLPASMHGYLRPGTTLVSFSSSDREFDGGAFRSQKGAQVDGMHAHHNGITLLYQGFPANFFSKNPDDPLFFQLIRSLILGSVAQAVESKERPGLHTLDQDFQRNVVHEFQKCRYVQEATTLFRTKAAHTPIGAHEILRNSDPKDHAIFGNLEKHKASNYNTQFEAELALARSR